MILLLGASGYVGSAFARFFDSEGIKYLPVSRQQVDYTDCDVLSGLIRDSSATFLINAAGYTGKPNVDACELHKSECLAGNSVLPGTIREACELAELPWGHVSSGCIYDGTLPSGRGFRETDTPNFCFRTDNCSFYSGSKALGEELLAGASQTYIWRLRMPFSRVDSPRNYLSKLMRYDRLLDATNSLSELDEFIATCWRCWNESVPYGIYNVTNGGAITTREVVDMIQSILRPGNDFTFFTDESEFMDLAAKTPRSNCVLDNAKLLDAGIPMSRVEDAIEQALSRWQKE